MYFDMYGPFEMARDDRCIASRQVALWAAVRGASERGGYVDTGLETAIGCYAFGLRYGHSLTPWYVGMTLARGGFRAEVLQKHKRAHYEEVIRSKRGVPVLFLMPLLTPEGRFSRDRTTSRPLISWTEKMLFSYALKRNPNCRNQRDTRYLRNVEIRGVFNSRVPGPAGATITAARQLFGN